VLADRLTEQTPATEPSALSPAVADLFD